MKCRSLRPACLALFGVGALVALTPGIASAQETNADVFTQHGWLAWAIVGAIGAAAGATELVAKYRDEPSRALTSQPAMLYIVMNAAASLIALFLIKELDWDFGVNPEQVGLVQIIVAGFGAMIILRTAVFTIRAPGKEAMVGPVNVLQTILDACDRAVDRKRASARAAEVSRLMRDISFDLAIIELPVVSLALMQSLSNEEQVRLRNGVDALRDSKLSNEGKCLSLGLVLIGALGEDALRSAIAAVKARIKLGESLQPVIDFMHPMSIPAAAIAEGEDVPLILSGQYFDSTSKVLLNGDVQTTEFDPLTGQLTAMLPVAALESLPEHEVTVFTRTNDGGESAPVVLRLEGVNPIPNLVSIEPTEISSETVAAGGEILLTLSGSDFVDGSELRIDGQKQETSFASGESLTARIAAAAIAAPGDHQVTVFNPTPLGGESTTPLTLTVVATGEPVVDVPVDPAVPPAHPDGGEGIVPPVADVVAPVDGAAPPMADADIPAPLAAEDVQIVVAADPATNGAQPGQPVVNAPVNQ